MKDLLPLFVALPIGAAFLIPLFSRRLPWLPDLLGNVVMAALTALAFLAACDPTAVCYTGGWPSPLGVHLRLDGLSALLLVFINLIGLVMSLYAVQYMRLYTSKFRYYILYLLLIAGLNGVVLSGDLFNIFIFMELATIASYALVAFGCDHEELEAAFKYALLGGLGSAFIMIGIALTYGLTGNLDLGRIAQHFASASLAGLPRSWMLALTLLVCGFALKTALVPFHAWLPDAHPSAPAPVSATLSGIVIKAIGIYVLARLVFNVFGAPANLLWILRTLGLVSMFVGVFLAIGQWDMKRLFAYHSISQIGYVALGLGLGTPLGIVGGLFHMVNHSVFKSLLFLNAGAVEYATGTRDLKRLGGLRQNMPVTAGTSLVASLSIAGIPPLNGFWSKLIIVLACIESGHPWLALAAVVVSLMTLASFLKVQKYAFFDAAKSAVAHVKEVPFLMRTAMLILAVLCLLMSCLVLTGLRSPFLVDPAAKVLEARSAALISGVEE